MTYLKHTSTLILVFFLSFNNASIGSDVPVLEAQAENRAVVVFLHGLGGKAGQITEHEEGRALFEGAIILEPDASEHGHAPGLWFPMELSLVYSEEILAMLQESEKTKPGIMAFIQKVGAALANSKGLLAGIGMLKDSHPFYKEAVEKDYLDAVMTVLNTSFSAAMAPTVAKLDKYIADNLKAHQVSHENLILCGSSMGAIMTLHYSFQLEAPCRALLAANGFFVPAPVVKSRPQDLVFVSGKKDKVIPHWIQGRSTNLLREGFHPEAEIFTAEGEGHDGFTPGTEQLAVIKTKLKAYIESIKARK